MSRPRDRRSDRGGERGSASVEAVIAAPAFMLFVGLIIFGGRYAVAHQAVQSAATEAARSASIARTAAQAERDAKEAAKVSLADQQLDCRQVHVDLDDAAFRTPVGTTALVTVSVECVLSLDDLAVPGVPGSRTIRATETSPLDTWRER